MAHLFHVGVGSGGMVVLDLLTRDPAVRAVTIVDRDRYESKNVYRHVFPPAGVGSQKADLAAAWVRERRPDLDVRVLHTDLTDPGVQPALEAAAAECTIGVCAVDNEPAKYHFDAIMRKAGKPWTLGEVLSGGIGGWVHRFTPTGPCYGCVASHLQRDVVEEAKAPAPDYSDPTGQVAETTIPAAKASIEVIAGLHAVATLEMLDGDEADDTAAAASLLFTLKRVPGVFDEAFRTYRFRIPRSPACLICSVTPTAAAGEDLDVALDQALARLGHE